MPASWSTPTTTSAGCSMRSKDLEILDDTLVYYIIGDNGASAEGTLNGAFNEMANFNGMAAHRDARVPDGARSTSSAARSPTTTTPSAGRTRWTRPTSGPSRSPRTGAARATARSCTGRRASRRRARFARSSTTSSTSRRPILEAAGLPEPTIVNGVQQAPIEGVSMLYSFDDAKAAERHETQYFEMFCNRGIYHKGWTAVTRHSTPWVMIGGSCPPSTTTSGNSTTATRTGRQAHDLAEGDAGEAARTAAAVADRGDQIQRAAARRPQSRALQSRPRGPAHARSRATRQLLFGGMGRLSRELRRRSSRTSRSR